MILVVDNHGFTTNILMHQLGAVHRVTATELPALRLEQYTHVVVTHGPDSADLTRLTALPQLPVLAIGAGYQQLAEAYGHTAVASAQPVYGQPVRHQHTGAELLAGIPNPTALVSYHAWRLIDMDSKKFAVHAVDENMAALIYRVNGTNHWGMHADPAALQSTLGPAIIRNFLASAKVAPAPSAELGPSPSIPRRLALHTRTVSGALNTSETFRRLQRHASAAFWLDSAAAHLGQGGTSIMGTNSGALAQTVRWDVETNQLDVYQDTTAQRFSGDVLEYLDANVWQPTQTVDLPGFTGGWVGYLGYEAKQATVPGHTNRWRATTPDAYWIRPQAFLRYDHQHQRTTLFAFDDVELLDILEAALIFGDTAPGKSTHSAAVQGRWQLTAVEYEQRVAQIQTMLHTGQAAGICLTDTYQLDNYTGDGFELYLRLRANNPAPYAGYFRFNTFDDTIEILSASPEKFLSVDAHGVIETKPIKGTLARSSDPTIDADIARRMAEDPKIQSENLMIADLLRDDLAQVTVPGSVDVPKLMAVETFATVHQLVTTVTGKLQPELSATAALRAVFPGGSMTGAPKLASLEALETFEAGPRGIYSGAMGWLGDNNTAEFNVIIRSIILHHDQLTIGAGGAVVVDSDPAAEEQEKHLKARALLESIAEHS